MCPPPVVAPTAPLSRAATWLLCLLFIWAQPARGGSSAITPQSQTQALVVALKKVVIAGEGKQLTDAQKDSNKSAFAELDALFDYDQLCHDAIAPHRAQLSPAQLGRYNKTFRSLLRLVSYQRSALFVQQAELTIGAPKMVGQRAMVQMHASMRAEDVQTDIGFIWQRDGATWRIVDVNFDGVSFVKDYQNQFGKMIKKYDPEGFLKKLGDRLAQEQKDACISQHG